MFGGMNKGDLIMVKRVSLAVMAAAIVVAGSPALPPPAMAANADALNKATRQVEKSPNGVYIAVMDLDPAVAYAGSIEGYEATKPGKGQKINPKSAHVKKYASLLKESHSKTLAAVGASSDAQLHSYTTALNGFAAKLTLEQASALAAKPGVRLVLPDQWRNHTTDSSPTFLGLTAEGSAYIIGEPGLINAMYNAGYTMNNFNPDYVVVGDTRGYSFEKLEQAVNLVIKGAKLIGTNPDLTGPVENGIVPATKALIAPIELATGRQAYFVGKPNPLMMRIALKMIGCSNEETIIIGDRMDTDIIAGIESEIETLLVLTGISTLKTVDKFPYRPSYILDGVAELIQ